MDSNSISKIPDVIIIGGGINGAAIARDAALRGMSVVLFEKEDFGSGASTKTSKLVHGGLRYLEFFDFNLVKESLKERSLLLKNAPHLTRPLSFFFPVYAGGPHPIWKVNLGLSIYDFLSRKKSQLPTHQKLSIEEIEKKFPDLKLSELVGGFLFSDAQMLDNRIIFENLRSAEEAGALIFNYQPVIGFHRVGNKIEGIIYQDKSKQEKQILKGKVIVNATGAWSDQIFHMEGSSAVKLVNPSKGIHLVIPRLINEHALLLRAPQDNRVFFVIPWEEYSLLGTTDTYYQGDLDHINIEIDERKYLLEALNAYFPKNAIRESDIISEFAGLRPLIYEKKNLRSFRRTRSHQIKVSEGVINVIGGKYTTHRRIAEDVVNFIEKQLPSNYPYRSCTTEQTPLPGGSLSFNEVKFRLNSEGLNQELIHHLLTSYGALSLKILDIMKINKECNNQICSNHPHIFAEINYVIEQEHAKTITDWFLRRTVIGYSKGRGLCCMDVVAAKFADLLGWSLEKINEEKNSYKSLINNERYNKL